jgi:hypothetical protein
LRDIENYGDVQRRYIARPETGIGDPEIDLFFALSFLLSINIRMPNSTDKPVILFLVRRFELFALLA